MAEVILDHELIIRPAFLFFHQCVLNDRTDQSFQFLVKFLPFQILFDLFLLTLSFMLMQREASLKIFNVDD